ncbi:ureidoglycolate lyase domain-containing protein [Hirsutella rhossiliensis]|uniref:Ureidoglycolate lyase domain-containing protein n=1 Tax=Hirsutella rhossiliensis TaxID=111463 RepID=A0A9P8MTK7_9HYPO|nr:ureidoglycolate lyase domain-containing protein [Hirsutella rhossiliensis]KAH0961903.1 ureidoglycolate lyase domain-containing protein [Hirsutella rhossiliensis]
MAAAATVRLGAGEHFEVQAEPLTAASFAPFGSVVANPRPDVDPGRDHGGLVLPPNAVSANQGSAIQYRDVGCVCNLYDQAPSGRGEPRMSVFVCAARGGGGDGEDSSAVLLPIRFLERHPFTTQTFSPLRSSASTYLVVVAPSLASPGPLDSTLGPRPANPPPPLPGTGGGGLPDLRRARAFVSSDAQAVTYGAGTWHAPMMVLGRRGEALAFVVTQFASGVPAEDCQLVEYVAAEGGAEIGIRVRVEGTPRVRERL